MTKKNTNLKKAARQYMADNPGTTYPAAKIEIEQQWAERQKVVDRLRAEPEKAAESPAPAPAPTPAPAKAESPLFEAIARRLSSLFGKELNIDPDREYRGGWSIDVDRDLEGPSQIVGIDAIPGTLDFQVHEVLDDGAELGEARVRVTLTYDAVVYKSDYYAASDDVDWWVDDSDFTEQYVLVNGEIEVELIANVVVNGPEEFEVEFMGIERGL